MKLNTIEYSPGDRLVYYNATKDIKIPIAFIPVVGDMVLLINSSSPYRTKLLINNAVSSMKAESIDGAPVIREDAFRLTNLTTKRVCRFAKLNGVYMKVTKVENVGRNANPSNVLGSTNFDLSKVPADIVRALHAINGNPVMPGIAKFGVYIPLQLFKLLDNKSHCSKFGEPYTFVLVHTKNSTGDGYYTLYKEIDGRRIWGEKIADYDNHGIHVAPRFKDATVTIYKLITDHSTSGSVQVSTEIGEILFRAHEASVIPESTTPTVHSKYRMAIMAKTEGAVLIGSVLVVQEMDGERVVNTFPVAELFKGIVTPNKGLEPYKEIIEKYIPGPYDHNVRPMDNAAGESFFKAKNVLERTKHSAPTANISSKVTGKKPEVKPLNIKSKTILI